VTVAKRNGKTDRVPATRSGDRWITSAKIAPTEAAYVCPGDVRDPWGNTNRERSPVVGDATVDASCAAG
jgi:hypothetical protein